ncbi:MAG: hypothetical protein NTZ46_09105 [Verrucomicrobia bacterium]|nr:hypothetical protein [Verrucomicrobiota bacterium]
MSSPVQHRLPLPPTLRSRLLDLAALLLLLVPGCWFWLYFFGYGHLRLSFEDWPVHAYYFDITRLSLTEGTIPWISNWSAHVTDKFLAIPETLLAPQILLMPWFTNGGFVAFHVCLLFCAGVWGWWKIKKRLCWSREAFLLAAVAVSFNGFVVAHLAAGHLMWAGCFLTPWLLLGLLNILEPKAPPFSWLPLAFSLFALFLLGAFHLAIWWIFFIGLACLGQPKAFASAFFAILGACGMAFFRLLPAKLFVPGRGDFLTGYPSLRTLLDAFTVIKGYTPGVPSDIPLTASQLGWWEFDHYTGWALLLLAVFGALATVIFRRKQTPFALPLVVGSLGMAILSYGTLFAWLYPIPLFHTERVVTRLISLSFTGLLFVAIAGLEGRESKQGRLLARLLCGAALGFAIHDCWAGAQPWLLFKLEAATPFSYYFPGLETLKPTLFLKAHQFWYHTTVIASTAFSFVAFTLLTALCFPNRRRRMEGWFADRRNALASIPVFKLIPSRKQHTKE